MSLPVFALVALCLYTLTLSFAAQSQPTRKPAMISNDDTERNYLAADAALLPLASRDAAGFSTWLRNRASLIRIYLQTGQRAAADQLLQQSLGSSATIYAADPWRVSYPLTVLAALLNDNDRAAEAETMYLRALELAEQPVVEQLEALFAGQKPRATAAQKEILSRVASIWHILGGYYQARGSDVVRVREYLDRALTLHRYLLPATHRVIGDDLYSLGLVALAGKEYAEAEQLLQSALDVRLANPDVAGGIGKTRAALARALAAQDSQNREAPRVLKNTSKTGRKSS